MGLKAKGENGAKALFCREFPEAMGARKHVPSVESYCTATGMDRTAFVGVLDGNVLLHDIGKAIDGEYEGSHAIVGADFVKARGESDIVVNAVAAHHNEVPTESLYAGIVILADTISAVRPGARSESIASYIDRLNSLEKLAVSFPGVKSAYAIQAGREVRVLVDPDDVSDVEAKLLSRSLRDRIEDELEYPSSIRITIIREQRFTDTAK